MPKSSKTLERRGKNVAAVFTIPLEKLKNLSSTLGTDSIRRLVRRTLSPFRLESRTR